jgi:hypothetical protein
MNRFLLKKIAPLSFFIAILLAPLGANAQTSSGIGSWLSQIFGWHAPLLSHVSNLLETRIDNVENTGIERNQLLNWRKGTISIKDSSPVLISYSLFEEKKTSIIVELLSAENSLKASRSKLYAFIDATTLQGNDMGALNASLAQVDTDITDTDSAIQTFANYEPATTSSSSDLIDLKVPQGYLDAAIISIQAARDSLKSAISLTGNSL